MAFDLAKFSGDPGLADRASRLSHALSQQEARERRGARRRLRLGRRTVNLERLSGPLPSERLPSEIRVPVPEMRYTEPIGIYGAGIAMLEEGPRPVILANERVTESSGEHAVPLREEPQISRRATAALGDHPPEETVVLAIPSPVPQFASGALAQGPGTRGTFGARVTVNGREAILTAGHVADKGQVVRDAEDRKGTVSYSISPTRTATGEVVADVAVVVPHLDGAWEQALDYADLGDVTGGSSVTMFGAESGKCTDRIWIVGWFVWGDNAPGQWKDVAVTTQVISEQGDSGAPVVLEDSDDLVGHLVGAVPGKGSLVQDIDCWLEATGATLVTHP